MSDRQEAALEFLKKQKSDLEIIQPFALETTNAIMAKERFHKWKIFVIGAVTEKLGPTYGQRLQLDWIDTAYAGGDMYDEIADDIEMCLRQLKNLIFEIETKGLLPLESDETPAS